MVFDYFKESQGYEALELPLEGFAMYRVFDKEFHIGHLYIKPELRHKGLAQKLGSDLERVARSRDCAVMSCVVDLNGAVPEVNSRLLKGYLMQGFQVLHATGQSLILKKDLI